MSNEDDDDYFYDDYYDTIDDDDDLDVDVCQHCGGFFAWTKEHREVSKRTGFTNHQRCIRCMVDECWIERN